LVVIATCVLVFWAMPRYGRTNLLVPIGICSIVGSLAVVFTQGFGAAIVYSVTTKNQFTHWFTYVTMVLMFAAQIMEINYLNVALNCFNTAMVTPVYYVTFTTSTIVASAVLFRGFDASAQDLITVVMGFIVIVSGVALLQLSKGSSDPAELPVSEIKEMLGPVEHPEEAELRDEEAAIESGPTHAATVPGLRTPRRSLRRQTVHDLERNRTLLQDFEAGPWALRSNPLQALFRRPALIAEELVHESRIHRLEQEERDCIQRRHTVSGMDRRLADVGSGQTSQLSSQPGARSAPQVADLASTDDSTPNQTMWHRIKTIYGDPRQQWQVPEEEGGIAAEAGSSRTLVRLSGEQPEWKQSKEAE